MTESSNERTRTCDRVNRLDALDPDSALGVSFNSTYYDETSLNSLLRDQHNYLNSHSLLFLNIRSVQKNLESLMNYLLNLSIKPSIIGLAETWLTTDSTHLCNAPPYRFHGKCREGRSGGGVGLLVCESLPFNPREDIGIFNEHIESVFIEIPSLGTSRGRLIIGTIYRSPGAAMDIFLHNLEIILNKIRVEKATCYLMGDFNVNLLNCDTHSHTNDFLDLMYSFSFHPLVDKPTRITAHSSTLIDNIFVNCLSDHRVCILYTDVSDHLPILAIDESRNNGQLSFTKCNTKYRKVNDRLVNRFNETLAATDWSDVYTITSTDAAYDHFLQIVCRIFENIFPLVQPKFSKRANKPWVSQAIKNSIRTKNKLYKLYHRVPTVYNEIKYKSYKKCLQKLIDVSKKEYYNSALCKHKGDLKQTWKILKEVIGVPNKTSVSKMFNIHGTTVSDPAVIAREFNKYFVNVGEKLAESIPPSDISPLFYVKNNTRGIFLAPVIEQEIDSCLTHMKDGSSGHDSLKPSIVKKCKAHFLAPLAHIFNLSLEQGTVPLSLKYAYVTPVFKAGDQCLMSNYRPISVLPVFSKILERLMFNRVYSFVTLNNILSDQQYGFRKKLSTEMALLRAVDRITAAIDNRQHTIGLFLDLKKAFDTVNIPILLSKLEKYGIRGIALSWFKSYLSNRKQSVKYFNITSSALPVTIGVPQGSILGPLLFILYINDMPNVLKSLWPIVFADDTTIFASATRIEEAIESFDNELPKLVQWFNCNKLSLNLSKTQYIIFTTSPDVRGMDKNFKIGDAVIDRVQKTKFLGVIIDERLCWSCHIDHVCTKIRKSLGVMKKASRLLSNDTLKMLYYTMIYPYLTYCHLIWGRASTIHLRRLTSLQKRAIRIVSQKPFLAHTHELFIVNRIIKFEDLYVYLLSLFIYKYIHRMYPLSFTRNININVNTISPSPSARRSTASIPLCRTNIRKMTIYYQIPKICNELLYPLSIPPEMSFYKFKKLMLSIST